MEGETVIAGVDTHKDVHVLCLLDGLGRKIRSGSFGADPEGYDRLAEAIGDPGSCMVVGVEGTASYGAGLTRRLVELGVQRAHGPEPRRRRAGGPRAREDAQGDAGDSEESRRGARPVRSHTRALGTGETAVDETGEEVLRAPVRIGESAPANCLLTTYRSVCFIFANSGMVEDARLNVVDSRISWQTVRFKTQDSPLRTAILEVAVE